MAGTSFRGIRARNVYLAGFRANEIAAPSRGDDLSTCPWIQWEDRLVLRAYVLLILCGGAAEEVAFEECGAGADVMLMHRR